MKRVITLIIFLVVVCTLIFSGCSGQSQSDTISESETTKPIKLLFATFEAETTGFMVEGVKAFGKDLEEKTNGKVIVEYSYAQALGKIPEYYDLTVRGVCDAGFAPPFMVPGTFPMSEIVTLPFKFPTAELATKAMFELYKKGYLDQAYDKDVKPLFITAGQADPFFTVKKPVTTLEDVKGLKIKTSGGQQNAKVEAMGGVPVVIAGSDVYVALEKGTVDGQITGYTALPQFKWCEVTSYVTEPPNGTATWAFFMNINSYNKLPQDVRDVIDEMAMNNEYGMIGARNLDKMAAAGKQCFIDHGGQIVEWEPGALEELNRRFEPIWEQWITEREGNALAAREAVNELYAILENLGVENPAFGYKL